jgi:hypothetical protein
MKGYRLVGADWLTVSELRAFLNGLSSKFDDAPVKLLTEDDSGYLRTYDAEGFADDPSSTPRVFLAAF